MPTARRLPDDALGFIQRSIRERKVYWIYHVNMRLAGRHNSRDDIFGTVDSYEVVEKEDMKCRVCGSMLHPKTTDLPFKVSDRTIVILKRLPVEQCEGCAEYLIADAVFAKVEQLLAKVDTSAELEIIQFAA